ncbi:MAG: hypothetical protein FRX48_04345 [Lasallia pustulata]|uniref:Uncharacterized protein n=1 Tax=Lasallia pustulata TaxID=136370 RepID=A0A5M8PRN6_9LECA|nr:MAG: hypothetical protein FRX48_04345 [Lasallia pustulata]
MKNKLQNNTGVEDRNTEHRTSYKKPNGVVKFDAEGSMWYREPYENDESAWKRAIWHDNIRDWLIEFTDRNGAYAHGRKKGDLENDVTSFHREHASWGYEIPSRPDILFQFEPLQRTDPEYKIGPWIHRGCIVLDADNHPVRNFKEIPLTCSTKIEPWLQETLRRMHSKITANDFRARMPRDPTGQGLRDSNGEWKGGGKDPLLSAATYDFQMTRFRQKHRCISWVVRGGGTAFRDYLWSIMTPEMRANNTTRGLGDVVDRGELAKMSLANKGKHLSRAGSRAISDDERKKRLTKEKARAAKFDQRQAAQNAPSFRKRKRADPAINNGNESVRPVLTKPVLSRTTRLFAESDQSAEEYGFYYNNKGDLESHHDGWKDRYEQYYEGDEESTDLHESAGNHVYFQSPSVSMRPPKKARTDGVLQEKTLEAFDEGANYIAQPLAWSGKYTSSLVLPKISSEGTADTLAALTENDDNIETYGGGDISQVTELNDGSRFLNKTPPTQAHKLLIHHLLQPSKEQYTSLTSQVPPGVDSNMSYLWQYGELSASLTQWWRSNGRKSVCPTLLGLVSCTASQLTWNTLSAPRLSVDITALLESVVLEDTDQEEAFVDQVDQDAANAWDDDLFRIYTHLD